MLWFFVVAETVALFSLTLFRFCFMWLLKKFQKLPVLISTICWDWSEGDNYDYRYLSSF